MSSLKVEIDVENNVISVYNNGRGKYLLCISMYLRFRGAIDDRLLAGIPVEMHPTEKMMVPEMIFGNLLTSSNYDDNEKRTTGGRNG